MTYAELVSAITSYTQNYEPEFLQSMPVFVKQAEQRIYNSVQIPSLRRNQTGVLVQGNKYLSAPSDFLSVYSLAVISDYDGPNTQYTYLLDKDVNFIREAYPNPNDQGLPKHYALFGPTTTASPYVNITNELSFILGPTPDAAYSVEMHYYYYPTSIVQGAINLLGEITGGSGYASGTYFNVDLTGGSGSGATANITVTNGVVTDVTLTSAGSLYVVGDVLSASQSDIGVGTLFTVPVFSIYNQDGTSWLGDNYDPVLLYASLREAYLFLKGEADIIANVEEKYKEALAQLNRLGTGLERGDAYRDGQAKIKVNP